MVDIVNALLIRENKVLLVKRSPSRSLYPNCWSFPGGHVERFETIEAALIRELGEEVGISPQAPKRLGKITDPALRRAGSVFYHMFRVTSWRGGEPVIKDNEHTRLEWFSLADALSLSDLALDEYRPLLIRTFAGLISSRE